MTGLKWKHWLPQATHEVKMAGVIRPLIWEIGDAAFSSFRDYTVFEIPVDLYDALVVAYKKGRDDDGF